MCEICITVGEMFLVYRYFYVTDLMAGVLTVYLS